MQILLFILLMSTILSLLYFFTVLVMGMGARSATKGFIKRKHKLSDKAVLHFLKASSKNPSNNLLFLYSPAVYFAMKNKSVRESYEEYHRVVLEEARTRNIV